MSAVEHFLETYEILEKLGEGSGGIVYKAYHKRLRMEVVLKQMKHKSVSMEVNRQEVDILKKLNHSYLPKVLDFINIDGDLYTVMSYIPGESLKQLMEKGTYFTKSQMIRWGMQICSALNYLHSQTPPIIHSDIKPANIMVTPDGNICLIDFNISFFLDGSTILGFTDGFTSPEQYIIALSSKSASTIPQHTKIDEKTDIYSVGATFYTLATGKKLSNKQKSIDYETLKGRMGEAFAQVIQKATQANPKERYKNAFEMFQAFKNITKKDRRYRQVLRNQFGIRVGIVLLMAGFIVLGGYGIHTMKIEKLDQYNQLVDEMVEARDEKRYEDVEDIYKKAVELFPAGLEANYQNAYSMYWQENYENCIEFIDYNILQNEKIDKLQTRMADVLYLKADSYFRLKDYENTVQVYDTLLEYGAQKSEYYRDYAIALAYDGQEKKAEEILQEAIDYGLKEDSIYYAKGEISHALGKNEAALDAFMQSIQVTEDNQIKMRAYLMISGIYNEANNLRGARTILQEAKQVLPIENQMQILESLAQTDIELAESSSDTQFRDEAISVLNEVIEQGWDTYETYNTLAVLYEKQENIKDAEHVVEKMQEIYGDDYNIYKRYAFLEIDKQELKSNSNRDYSRFKTYYEQAMQMYQDQLQDNNTDMEMQLLENVYEQVVSGGWL